MKFKSRYPGDSGRFSMMVSLGFGVPSDHLDMGLFPTTFILKFIFPPFR